MPDLAALLRPRSIALVGASPDTHIIRGRLLDAVLRSGYPGAVYPISRSHTEIQGLRCHASVSELPEAPDLALIAVPAEFVADALEDCAAAGVRAAVIISSGFAEERGAGGAERQRRVSAIAAAHDMAVLGPNGEGFANAMLPLAASFSPAVHGFEGPLLPPQVRAGRIAVTSQSGGMGFAFFDEGRARGVPFSYVISTGNEAGLESLDVAAHLAGDADVDVLLMFIEGLRTPAKLDAFARAAAAAGKPVIVAKVGRGEAARAGAAAHTASIAGSDEAYRAMFARCGFTLADDLHHAVDLASAFAFHHRRLPQGTRVGILTPSGGAGIWFADVCERAGLQVPELDTATREAFDALLPAYGASRNPVDLTAQFIFQHGYGKALEILARSPQVDAIMVASSLIRVGALAREADELVALGARLNKPVIFCSYTRPDSGNAAVLGRAGIPCFTDMPNAASAILALARYREFLGQGIPPLAAKVPAPASALPAGVQVITEHAALELLRASGMPAPPAHLVRDADAAVAAARELGGAIALKVQSPDIAHKSEAGAIALDVRGDDAVREAFARILASASRHAPAARIDGVRVQPMAGAGVEMIVGVQHDRDFGPMLVVGTGGIFVEILADAAMAPAPVEHAEAMRLIDSLAGARLLAGVRGRPAADIEALADLMVTLSRFAAAHAGRIESLDLNPVIVHARGEGLSIADALIVTRDAHAG